MKTGWCLTKDCDAEDGRGGCPIQTGSIPPCACECHGGATQGRGFIPSRGDRAVPLRPAAPEEPVAQAA